MSKPEDRDEFHLAWEGAEHPDGPWRHLRILELSGEEALSEPFWFSFEVVHDMRGKDVDVEELIGAAAALKMFTRTQPAHRIVHGVLAEATQLETASTDMARYRLVMRPPLIRSAMMRASHIYLEKTLRQILEEVLQRTALGAGLTPSSTPRPLDATDDLTAYQRPTLAFAWAIEDATRLDDLAARPYCVQYDESDFDFVSRILEEEGISYHFEHGDDECVLVMSDFDRGRIDRSADAPVGPHLLGREVFDWRAGGRLRPRSVHLDDYNWRHPNLDLRAQSPSGVTDFTDIAHPGRYEATAAHGRFLAARREQRFDAERSYATADSHCRLITAGTVLRLEHHVDKFAGVYLVTRVRHHGVQRDAYTPGDPPHGPYRQQLELLGCGKQMDGTPSNFRPARVTPKPRIFGTQTAVVTADPSDPEAEINVGGPSDIGCVRVCFHWDMNAARRENEPSSCWVRVSQFFAGSDHGALWHPRVGNEVIVEFIDGDPDRPIVTGRVYNGTNVAPENATSRPTYSAIKSLTSPFNGNYNLIAFEDQQGSEEIIIHAARDWNSNVERNCTRGVGVDETIHIKGDQYLTVDGMQQVVIGTNQTISVGAERLCQAGTSITNVSVTIENHAEAMFGAHAGVVFQVDAGAVGFVKAPITRVDANVLFLVGNALVKTFGSVVDIEGGSEVTIKAPSVKVHGSGNVLVTGGAVNIAGAPVTINGDSLVDVDAGVIHLN